jgi:dihydroneopterin aldolase
MSYTIRLKNCSFFAYHGVLQSETETGQRFHVDLDLTVRKTDAVADDDISGAVHYGEVFALVEQVVTGPPLKLIEHLAGRIGEEICGNFPLVEEAVVTVRKPSAPIPGVLDHVEVVVTTTRS